MGDRLCGGSADGVELSDLDAVGWQMESTFVGPISISTLTSRPSIGSDSSSRKSSDSSARTSSI